MEKISEYIPFKVDRNVKLIIGAVAGVAGTGYLLAKLIAKSKLDEARQKWNEAGKDVVVLHMFERPFDCLNLSPFPIKLETFLRINKINYMTDFQYPLSSKGKSPWITFNGVDIADSQLAIEHLSEQLNINMNSHLTPVEAAIARGFRSILEDHLYFLIVIEKWTIGRGRTMLTQSEIPYGKFGKFLWTILLEKYAKVLEMQAYMQGLGRHSIEDVRRWTVQDIICLENFLGDKPYLMGNKPSEVDCIFFGFMVIGKYAPLDGKPMLEGYPNICKYVDRMKEEFFPDWEDVVKRREQED